MPVNARPCFLKDENEEPILPYTDSTLVKSGIDSTVDKDLELIRNEIKDIKQEISNIGKLIENIIAQIPV